MSIFSEAELAFLREVRLARLATIGPDGAPQVRPVGFVVDAEADTVTSSASVRPRSPTVVSFFIPVPFVEVVPSSFGGLRVRAGDIPGLVPVTTLP